MELAYYPSFVLGYLVAARFNIWVVGFCVNAFTIYLCWICTEPYCVNHK
jgi:hypothetical protein